MSRLADQQRSDRPRWSLDDASAPLASSSGATAAFTLRVDSALRPSSVAAVPWSKLVTAEFFNDEPAAEASYWQELHIHDYLTHSSTLSLDDRKLYMRQRTSAKTATPGLSLAEELCQLRAFERRRRKNESQYHLLCYESYDGTLEIAVDRSSSSSASSASSASSRRRSDLRTSLFWCGDADGRADAHAMRSQSSAFIVHCLRCLQAHHQQQVLLGGNIQPAQLFYTNEQPAKPVLADYSHATALKLSQVNPHFTIQGHCSSNSRAQQPLTPVSISWREASDSVQRRATQPLLPSCLVRRPTLATESPSTFGSVVNQLKICLKRDDVLASLVPPPLDSERAQLAADRGSNSSRYRAPEAESSGERSGFCCEASDVYSMCATLIDVLCGHDRDPPGTPSVKDLFLEECSRQFNEDDPWTRSEWIKLGAPAIVDGNVVHFFREAMKTVSVYWELSELIDQVQSSDAAWTQHQLRMAAAAAAKAPPLYATCQQLCARQLENVRPSRHGLTFSVSPRSTVVEEQPSSRPTLIAKRFPLPSSAAHRYQSRIADHLQAAMTPDDHRRFVRQRVRPDERLERAIAADLYTQSPRSPRVASQHRRTDAERREHAFGLSRKEVMFFRYYSGSLDDAIVTTASEYTRLRTDWFWQIQSDSSPHALQGDAEAMQHKALRFVLHCLQGLAAHHAAGVLLGDIKPANLFYDHPLSDQQEGAAAVAATSSSNSSSSSSNSSFDRECRPRWGDYDHAVNMHSAEWGSHVRIISQAADRFGGYYYGAGELQRQRADEAKETGELIGVLTQSIGTWPYQAPEIFISPALSIVVLTGQYHSRSDAYALALTLLEVCVGRPFVATSSAPLAELQKSHVQPLLSFSRAAARAAATCSQLAMTSWIQQPFALLPEEVIELLQQLLLHQLHQRPTIADVIAVVEACLPGASELPPLMPLRCN